MTRDREVLSLEPIADEPEVGRWLSALEDCRRDTLRELEPVTDAMIDVEPAGVDPIGTLLYHVALIEADWLLSDVLGPETTVPSWLEELLPLPDRDEDGRLTRLKGEDLVTHLGRLERIRAFLIEQMTPMSLEDFHRLRARESWDVSAAWVVHHLLQHEAEHRSQIAWTRDAVAAADT